MALAFFTTPTFPSLATFGLGGATTESETTENSSEQSKSPETSLKPPPTTADKRPVSASVGAIIKCSDCGGDVPLMELGEHVCSSPQPSKAPPAVPAAPISPPKEKFKEIPPDIPRASLPKTQSKPRMPEQPLSTPPSPPKSESPPPPAEQPSFVASLFSSFVTPATEPDSSPPPPALPPILEQSSSRNTSHRARAQELSSSGSSVVNSEFSGSSSQASRSRIPFLEKYAELVPLNNPTPSITHSAGRRMQSNSKTDGVRSGSITSTSQSTSSSRPSPPSTDPPPSSAPSITPTDPIRTTKPKSKPKPKKILTPPTSPELSPSEKVGFASLQRSQLRSGLSSSTSMPFNTNSNRSINESRREIKPTSDSRRMPTSQSASTGLDKLLASDAFSHASFDRDDSRSKKFETPRAHDRSAGTSSRKPSNGGLEDLMGDLMSEMTRKAERSTHELQEKIKSSPRNSGTSSKSPHKRSVTESDARPYGGHDPDKTPRMPVRNSASEDSPPVPDSPGIRPSDSISQFGLEHPPSPPAARALFPSTGKLEGHCHHCGKPTDSRTAKVRESSITKGGTARATFCHPCYSELYLPKCRKCDRPIERGAVTDRVGKVLGKYHPECFNCFKCSAKFPHGEFYVWERKPVCAKHYHRFAGTICANEFCKRGIEGPCVSLSLDGSDSKSGEGSSERRLYHPEHFTCSRRGCNTSLAEFHFVIECKPWCEKHALEQQSAKPTPQPPSGHGPWGRKPPRPPGHDPNPASHPSRSGKKMERRRTIIQNVRER